MTIIEISVVVHDGVVVVPASLEGHRLHLTIIDQGPGEAVGSSRHQRFGASAIPGISIAPLSRDQANQRP